VQNRVRELRGERGWSQSDLGDRLGVSRQSIDAIEAGRYDPSLPLAFKIAATFGLAIEQVFTPDPEPEARH
jgi:putative transcriptional regulator